MAPVRFIAGLLRRFSKQNSGFSESAGNPDHEFGREGERLAARYLRRNGYKVLYRNFRGPHGGEVDLVCRDKTCNTLAFVEVKSRSSVAFGTPGEAVTREKQKLIARGALAWLDLLGRPPIHFRFDIVEIVVETDTPTFHLIKDAFKLPEQYVYE
ncbi:MAG TPA: YraN family protein [Chthoniobacter sp.]|jgi:putative endonuclease